MQKAQLIISEKELENMNAERARNAYVMGFIVVTASIIIALLLARPLVIAVDQELGIYKTHQTESRTK